MTWILFIIVTMIVLNALYVSAEFAVISVRRSSIQQLAAEGSRTARALLPIIEDGHKLDNYIATCQIGITLTSIVLGAFGQSTMTRQMTPIVQQLAGIPLEAALTITTLLVLVGLTVVQMILGELVPKSISLQFPAKTALLTYLPMRWSMIIFSWFITILNGSGFAILKVFGVKQSAHRHIHSANELELLITESRDGGALEPDEHARLKKALALSTRKASEIMVPRPKIVAINIKATPEHIMKIVAESPYTRFPVYSSSTDNIIGMLHAKDFVTHYIRGIMPPLKDLIRPIPSIPASVSAERLLTLLRKRKAHQAIVINEFGTVDGIVTLEDVLSEMMGEVGDEFKDSESVPERLPDGRVRLPGDLRLDEAEPWLGVLWQGNSHTISGRVMEALGSIPTSGDRTQIDGVDVEVERMDRHVIRSILARPRHRAGVKA